MITVGTMKPRQSTTGTAMDLAVTRLGGVAGVPTTWTVHIDDEPDAGAWHQLLQRLPWEQVRSQVAHAPEPDRFTYRISCPPHAVVLTESRVEGPWRELIDRIRAAASTQSRTAQ